MKFNKPKFWDYKKPNLLSYILTPFSFPIILNNLINNIKKKNKTPEIIKICFGNIYIGGTGKTPLAIKTNNLLNDKNYKSVLIKKFYNDQIDEQKLIQSHTKFFIFNKKRLEAVKEAIKLKFKFAIFDDGLQDNSLNYDIKIVCFNLNQWIGNGQLIPAGPLREKINSLKKYDAVVLNGDEENKEKIKFEIKEINKKIRIFESEYKIQNIDSFDLKLNYIIFSGIGSPQNFSKILKKNNFKIIKEFYFPDHYNYSEKEMKRILNFASGNNCKIISTEKDYFRINQKYSGQISFLKLKKIIKNENNFLEYMLNENN